MIKKENIKKRAGALLIAGGIAIGAVGGIKLADRVDNPIYQVCPITKITTKLFGKEAGAKHQINHINSFVGDAASMVDYMDEINLSIYGNGTYEENNEYYKIIEATQITTDEGVTYVVPAGYTLFEKNGKFYGKKEATPEKVITLPPSIATIYDDGTGAKEVDLLFENGMWQDAKEEVPKLTK